MPEVVQPQVLGQTGRADRGMRSIRWSWMARRRSASTMAAIRRRTGFLRRLLLEGALVELAGVLDVLAGVGRPVGLAQPLMERGRLLVQLDRPGVGGQLPPLGARAR
jgi:hypothetical protein